LPSAQNKPESTPDHSGQPIPWQQAMRLAVRSSSQLREMLGLASPETAINEAEKSFPTFVSREFIRRMEYGNPSDPLLLQVLAVGEESLSEAGFVSDPVGDGPATVAPGLIQKYAHRALVIMTGVCGVHCRYCFRREFDYSSATAGAESRLADDEENSSDGESWAAAVSELRTRHEVDEVILSGGDPLTISDAKFSRLLSAIESIPHVKRLRIHSRMPIVIPQRVTPELLTRLKSSHLATWMVVHCNHAAEIDASVESAVATLVDHGIPVLNQAVLLRGVNDSVEALENLCRRLVNLRVQPYYLNQLDRVRGSAHFEVPETRGLELIEELRARLPGYAVPRYVMEVAGAVSKSPVTPSGSRG